ncbi:MAG: glycosyltransferase family 4 protein [Fuerstiella sp.]
MKAAPIDASAGIKSTETPWLRRYVEQILQFFAELDVWRMVPLLAVALLATGVAATSSRGGILALVVSVAATIAFRSSGRRLPAAILTLTVCGGGVYLQDIYPDVAVALGKVSNNWAIRRLRKSLFDIYRRCDRMVVLSSDMKALLLDSGIPDQRVAIIPNWADTQQIIPVESDNHFRKRFGLEAKFVVMYSGNLGLTQRLEEFVEAAAILREDSMIQFVFVGQGARRKDLQQQVDALGLSNVMFCDYQPLDELSHSLSAGDLHLVPLTAELSRCLMPSKLYGILAAGRPFLTNAPQTSELYEVTKSHNVGFTVEAGSPELIAQAVLAASNDCVGLKEMGQRARTLAEEKYSKSRSVAAFAQTLGEVVGEYSEFR